MRKQVLAALFVASVFMLTARAAEEVVSAEHGTVSKVDAASKTIAVKTKDGTEETFRVGDKAVVHGVKASEASAKDSFHGIKEGSEVVAHYTVKGTEKTAVEVDHVGKGGLQATEGTVSKVSEDGKTVFVKTADGTEDTFRVTGHATAKTAEEVAKGTDKSAKVTVYYTEASGKKVAHFFEKL